MLKRIPNKIDELELDLDSLESVPIVHRSPILHKSGNTVIGYYGMYKDKDGTIKPIYQSITINGEISGNLRFIYKDDQ